MNSGPWIESVPVKFQTRTYSQQNMYTCGSGIHTYLRYRVVHWAKNLFVWPKEVTTALKGSFKWIENYPWMHAIVCGIHKWNIADNFWHMQYVNKNIMPTLVHKRNNAENFV